MPWPVGSDTPLGSDFQAAKTKLHIKKETSEAKNLYNRRQFTHVWIQLLLISLKVDTTSAEIIHLDALPRMRCDNVASMFKNTLSASRYSSKFWWRTEMLVCWLDFSLHICWNITKWDLGRHETSNLAQKISNQNGSASTSSCLRVPFCSCQLHYCFRKKGGSPVALIHNSSGLTPGIFLLWPRLKVTLGPCASSL